MSENDWRLKKKNLNLCFPKVNMLSKRKKKSGPKDKSLHNELKKIKAVNSRLGVTWLKVGKNQKER